MPEQNRPTYELIYVVNTVLNDEQVEDIVARVTAFIRESGGDIVEEEQWGNRRFAYPIEKKRNGYYALVYFRADPGLIAKLDRALRINDDILRHLVLRYDAKMLRHYEKRKQEAAKTAAAAAAEEAAAPAEA